MMELSDYEIMEVWAERAAIREYEGEMPRDEAEQAADDDVDRMLSTGFFTDQPNEIDNA